MEIASLLEELKRIVPVPEAPIDVDQSMLADTIKALNVPFPQDYLAYARVYGSGTIMAKYAWEIISPFRPNFPEFVRKFFRRQDGYRQPMETQHLPLGLFPEPGGLLPFGHDDDEYFTWKTDGDPDRWRVVVIWRYDEEGYQEFNMGFLEFLVGFLTLKLKVPGYDLLWDPKKDISFDPVIYGI